MLSVELIGFSKFTITGVDALPRHLNDILNNVWGYTPERLIDLRVVDVHISRLRRKLEDNPKTPELILTIRGAGYRFQQY